MVFLIGNGADAADAFLEKTSQISMICNNSHRVADSVEIFRKSAEILTESVYTLCESSEKQADILTFPLFSVTIIAVNLPLLVPFWRFAARWITARSRYLPSDLRMPAYSYHCFCYISHSPLVSQSKTSSAESTIHRRRSP